MTLDDPVAPRNRFMERLPAATREWLDANAERVEVARDGRFLAPHEPAAYAYLPESALASLVVVMHDGRAAEVTTIGTDGIVGSGVGPPLPVHGIWQIAGWTLRIDGRVLAQRIAEDDGLRRCIDECVAAQSAEMAQTAACNRLHDTTKRAARWLLTTSDKMANTEVAITQEYFAILLAATRPHVSEVVGVLRAAGAISFRRGAITIEDREKLRQIACECFDVIRRLSSSP